MLLSWVHLPDARRRRTYISYTRTHNAAPLCIREREEGGGKERERERREREKTLVHSPRIGSFQGFFGMPKNLRLVSASCSRSPGSSSSVFEVVDTRNARAARAPIESRSLARYETLPWCNCARVIPCIEDGCRSQAHAIDTAGARGGRYRPR